MMNSGRRCLMRRMVTQATFPRLVINTTRPLTYSRTSTILTQYWRNISKTHNSCCNFSTSQVHFKDDKSSSTDVNEAAIFDKFYEAVIEESKNNHVAIQQIQKAKLSEADKKRAIQRWTFDQVVDIYCKNNANRRRHVEFIYEALDRIISLGLGRDLEAYKKLLMAFPQDGRMVARSKWLVESKYYPKQQDCALDLMNQMDENGLIPDEQFCQLVESLFGSRSHVFRKIRRTLYWARKFNNANPYQLPFHLPDDPIDLAALALRKMAIDLQNEITIWKTTEAGEEVFIASAQSCNQRNLIQQHKTDKPIYVEGGYNIWLRDTSLIYFVLRADSDPALFPDPVLDEEDEGLFHFETVFETEKPKEVMPRPSKHQQEDGTVLAMCITGTSSKESLIDWVRFLQQSNPNLEQTPIVFKLRSPVDDENILSIDHKGGELEPV